MRRLTYLGFITSLLFSFTSQAETAFIQRNDVQLFIKNMVKQHHFNEQQLINTLSQVQLQPQIIESMEKPYEKKNWDVYRKIFLTPQRLKGGLDFWSANQKSLEKAQKRYHVPAEIIVAILGVETLYGARQGEYKVLDSLSTLAFNYPKRSAFFSKELTEYLLMCREHNIPATYYYGSYAGAMGKPQFMPSSYRYYAVDFNYNGKRDLINENEDAIGSVANYFHKHGWKSHQGIIQHAKITGTRYKQIAINPKSANYRYSQLESAGVKPLTAAYNHPNRAALLEFITDEGNEYWLAYPNFFVITRYNSSPQYALVVYLLSQELKKQWIEMNTKKHKAYV